MRHQQRQFCCPLISLDRDLTLDVIAISISLHARIGNTTPGRNRDTRQYPLSELWPQPGSFSRREQPMEMHQLTQPFGLRARISPRPAANLIHAYQVEVVHQRGSRTRQIDSSIKSTAVMNIEGGHPNGALCG